MASQGDTHEHTCKGTIVAVVKREGLGARLLWYRGCRASNGGRDTSETAAERTNAGNTKKLIKNII